MVNQKVCKKEYLSWVCGVDRKNLSLGITVRHHSASLVMTISDPRDGFFYPHHTPMKDTYYLSLFLSDGISLPIKKQYLWEEKKRIIKKVYLNGCLLIKKVYLNGCLMFVI